MAKYDSWSLERIERALDDARLGDDLARRISKAHILDLQAAYECKLAERPAPPNARTIAANAIESGEGFGKLGG